MTGIGLALVLGLSGQTTSPFFGTWEGFVGAVGKSASCELVVERDGSAWGSIARNEYLYSMHVTPNGKFTYRGLPNDVDYFSELTLVGANHAHVTVMQKGPSWSPAEAIEGRLVRIGDKVSPFAGVWKGRILVDVPSLHARQTIGMKPASEPGSPCTLTVMSDGLYGANVLGGGHLSGYVPADGQIGLGGKSIPDDEFTRFSVLPKRQLRVDFFHAEMGSYGSSSTPFTLLGPAPKQSRFMGNWTGLVGFGGDQSADLRLSVDELGDFDASMKGFKTFGTVLANGRIDPGFVYDSDYLVSQFKLLDSSHLRVRLTRRGVGTSAVLSRG